MGTNGGCETKRTRRAVAAVKLPLSLLIVLVPAAIIALALLARRVNLPYPIVFVIAGSLIAFIPNLPPLTLNPDWIFLIILPPLLFAGGWTTDWKEFKTRLRPILLLAIGLVVATTVVVAAIAHAFIPDIGWASAFALGAIVSPPDAVAAEEVFQQFSVPRRIMTILSGEGLVNDASALVIYRFAVAAVVTGTFSLTHALGSFVIVAVGGVAIGLALGYVGALLLKFLKKTDLSDALLSNIVSLLAPYAIYATADSLGLSGVLATVTAGIYISRQASKVMDPETRLTSSAVWNVMTFLFNGFVFLAIGLSIREIVRDPSFIGREWWIGLVVSITVIVVRLLWIYPAAYIPRMLSRRIRESEERPPISYVFIIGWSGMRGVVSLAAALGLPLLTNSGTPFPARNEIVFITFCVIFATLVVQGTSLIPLIRWLGVEGGNLAQEELEARIAALRAGLARLRDLEKTFVSVEEWQVEGRIVAEYEYRIGHLLGHTSGAAGTELSETAETRIDHKLQNEALEAEQREILRLRSIGEIPDDVYRVVQYDLDLANARLT
jgi:Na+/H+ antiporter